MENNENLGDGETKIINFADYQRKQAIIGILNRPELSEQMKKCPSNKPTVSMTYDKEIMERFYHESDRLEASFSKEAPPMKVVYSKEEEKATLARFFALSDHLDQK